MGSRLGKGVLHRGFKVSNKKHKSLIVRKINFIPKPYLDFSVWRHKPLTISEIKNYELSKCFSIRNISPEDQFSFPRNVLSKPHSSICKHIV